MIALGSVVLSGIIIHFSLSRQFQDYLTRSQSVREEQIVQALAEFYEQNGGWPSVASPVGFARAMSLGNLRYVTDINGRVVLFTRQAVINRNDKNLSAIPVLLGRKMIGTAYFGLNPLQEVLSKLDQSFRTTINRSIFLSILLTGVFSLVIAALFAKRLSDPITEMHHIAKEMTSANLESRVANLPPDELGELGQSLNQLADRLQQMNALRQKMTADVAHELRTPLATVKSHLEGMIDQVIPASSDNLQSLLEEVDRLAALINKLQEIAVVEAKIHRLSKEPLELEEFLSQTIKKILPVYREKDISISLDSSGPLIITTDSEALGRIMDNLLSNALKYTFPQKSVRIMLCEEDHHAVIKVRDHGIGIAETDLPFIFERFYRVDPSRHRDSGGFGLGLTIVKELAGALDGEITATSVLGEGSEFIVKLPKR